MERRSAREWLRELLLTAGAVIGVICLLAAVGSTVFGLQPLIFRSGSMEPAIGTGALALARNVPVDTVRPGDVVSVIAPSGTRITHRVISATPGTMTTLILKGDANELPDADAYSVSQVALVVGHVEYLGYLVSGLRHPAAIFIGGVLVGVLGMIAFTTRGPLPPRESKSDDDHDRELDGNDDSAPSADRPQLTEPPRHALHMADHGMRWRRPVTSLLVVVTLLAAGAGIRDTQAAFTDTGTARSGTFATRDRIAAPELNCSGLGLLAINFTWNRITDATGYDLVLIASTGGSTTYSPAAGATSYTVTGALGRGTAFVRAKTVYPSTTWYSAPSNTRTYTFAVISLCN